MFLEALIASSVLALVVVAWVLVQRWTASQTYPDECNLPRSECSHCISRDGCLLHTGDDTEHQSEQDSQ